MTQDKEIKRNKRKIPHLQPICPKCDGICKKILSKNKTIIKDRIMHSISPKLKLDIIVQDEFRDMKKEMRGFKWDKPLPDKIKCEPLSKFFNKFMKLLAKQQTKDMNKEKEFDRKKIPRKEITKQEQEVLDEIKNIDLAYLCIGIDTCKKIEAWQDRLKD